MEIYYLEKNINNCNIELYHNNNKILEYEREYDSLVQFKGNMDSSYNEINIANRNKKNSLEFVKIVYKNCMTAQKYYDGMSDMLDDFNNSIFVRFFDSMRESINIELSQIYQNIQSLEKRNVVIKNRIINLEKELTTEKSKIETIKRSQ